MIDLQQYHAQRTSQHGENGIIEAIFNTIGTHNRICVDVGARDLTYLSNVYELWHNQGWYAVLVDASAYFCNTMINQSAGIPNVLVLNLEVMPEGDRSIDSILTAKGDVPTDLDLLCIDVDGIDYHLWAGVEKFRPRVVVIEFNPTIPPHLEVIGRKDGNYVGSSARAMCNLALTKGYSLVASTKINAFFVVNEEAGVFENLNDLPLMFDYKHIVYAMTSYDGGMFLSYPVEPSYGMMLDSDRVRSYLAEPEKFMLP